MRSIKLLAFTVLLTASTSAMAASAIIFTGGTPTDNFNDRTLGYEFSTNDGITIGALGYWDEGGDGLLESHEIGIWSGDGSTLLASAIIPGGTAGTLDSGFRFVSIAPVFLAGGVSYLAGGFTGSAGDPITRLTTATTIPEVTLGNTRFDPSPFSGSFTTPTGTQDSTFDDGYFGPSFALVSGAVPEPSTWAMTILGFGLLGAAVRRRRKLDVRFAF